MSANLTVHIARSNRGRSPHRQLSTSRALIENHESKTTADARRRCVIQLAELFSTTTCRLSYRSYAFLQHATNIDKHQNGPQVAPSEPVIPTNDDESGRKEYRNMALRFWISLPLSAVLLSIAMFGFPPIPEHIQP